MDNPQYPGRKFLKAKSRRRSDVPQTFLQSRQIFPESILEDDNDVSHENPCKRQKITHQEVVHPPNKPATIPSLKCTIGKKSSANARLVTYRNILNSANERVKVHTLEVVKQVSDTPATSRELEGISRLENSISPNKPLEFKDDGPQITQKQAETDCNLGKKLNVVKRSNSLQDRLNKYKLPTNDCCDNTVQNCNTPKTSASVSKITHHPNKTNDYNSNKTIDKKTIDFTSKTKHSAKKTIENVSKTNFKETIECSNKTIDNFKNKKTHNYTSTIVNPNETSDYTNKTVHNPKKTIDYTNKTTVDKHKETIDCTSVATNNPNKTIDYMNQTEDTPNKTIDYSYKATDNLFCSSWQSRNNSSTETITNEGINLFAYKPQSSAYVQNLENANYSREIFGNTSTDSGSDFYEEQMDWSPVEDSFVLENINTMRQNFDQVVQYQTPFNQMVTENLEELPRNNSVFKDIYIVVDTNIFLSHLSLVRELMELKLNGVVEPIILIPWFVIQELDYIKDGRSGVKRLQHNAQHAVKFIHENLVAKRRNFKGQTVMDAMNDRLNSSSPDDGILACCMQVQDRGNTAFLLTNDKNLCNKAIINDIQAFTHDTIMPSLRPSQVSPEARSRLESLANKGERIRQLVGHLFSYIILERTSKEFGPTLSKVALMKNPPWCLPDCLYRFEKLWISVFSGNLSKYFLKAVQDFKKFIIANRKFDSDDVLKKFVEHSLTCCVYLKNAWEGHFSQTVSECISSITSIMDDDRL